VFFFFFFFKEMLVANGERGRKPIGTTMEVASLPLTAER